MALGLSLFALTFTADFVMSHLILKRDPIYTMRRTAVLSLFGLAFWFVFILIGAILSFALNSWLIWVELGLLGYGINVTLRIIVLIATSMASNLKKGLCVLMQPVLCVAAFIIFLAGIRGALFLQVLPYIAVAPAIGLVAVIVFYGSIERLSKNYSMSSMALFQAFIVNWVTGINTPLESHFEKMGQDADIEVNMIKFESSKPKAAIIVPQVHPGPFKNIGSSLFPSLLKDSFEAQYGCGTCTPLGILGHELDLASQEQNHKIVSQVLSSADFHAQETFASPFVRVTEGDATASCQIFGDTVFLSFTLAPKTTEDLPQELGHFVIEKAAKLGLKHTLVVNTHNSLENDTLDTDQHLSDFQDAASKCLQKAVTLTTTPVLGGIIKPFSQRILLEGWNGNRRNNCNRHRSRKTENCLRCHRRQQHDSRSKRKNPCGIEFLGVRQSEIFTTDTHAVSALVTGRQATTQSEKSWIMNC